MSRLRSGRQGALARLGIWTQVLVTSVLALAAVLMVNWLTARPALRVRADLTATGQNTVGTATRGVLDRLQDEVTIDVFFRPEEAPLTAVAFAAQDRTRRLLLTLREAAEGRIVVRENDTTDLREIEARQRELKLRGFENCLVVSQGEQREVLRLRGDLAVFDPGRPRPNPAPARIVEFHAERAIVKGILSVTRGDVRDVYFTIGHGERELFDEQVGGMSELESMLADEGLRANRWSPVEDGPLPEDCACLSIVGPTEGLADSTLDQIESWVRAGGRLVVAPNPDDRAMQKSGLPGLLERFQIEVQPGIVCQPYPDPQTGRPAAGAEAVSSFWVLPENMALHPLLAPIRDDRRSFVMAGCHPVRVTGQPRQGVSSPLFTSTADAWVDYFERLPTGEYSPNWKPDPDAGEPVGRKFQLAVASSFRPEGGEVPAALEEEVEARLVVVGSSYAFANDAARFNTDFLRNVYNWVLDREFRVSISPRDPDLRLVPPEDQARVLPRVNQFAWGWLPGLCLVLGLATALLRSRGGPTRRRGEGGAR